MFGLLAPEDAGTFALGSILISALTTGYTAAIMAFNYDISGHKRRFNQKICGFVPNDHSKRGTCVKLMTTISALHNPSRSIGVALFAAEDWRLVLLFIGDEMLVYFAVKVARGDFWFWMRTHGLAASLIAGFLGRVIIKVRGLWRSQDEYDKRA